MTEDSPASHDASSPGVMESYLCADIYQRLGRIVDHSKVLLCFIEHVSPSTLMPL